VSAKIPVQQVRQHDPAGFLPPRHTLLKRETR
jgi:hypothetical protein